MVRRYTLYDLFDCFVTFPRQSVILNIPPLLATILAYKDSALEVRFPQDIFAFSVS